MQQVHGDRVVRVDVGDDGKTIPDCDALITNDIKVELAVRTADCLPIAVKDKKNHALAVVHAGWRGLYKEIIAKAINRMIKEFSSNTENLKVFIGPHICKKHYEVKEDVSGKFKKYKVGEFMDLAQVAVSQLTELGVKGKDIKIARRCTFEDKKLFSHRRGDLGKSNITVFARPY